MEQLASDGVPRLGFCGNSGSGKTTIIEKIIPLLRGMGLKAGYLKHGAHALQSDREGKDTWRIFNSGAEVISADSPGETFTRARESGPAASGLFAECDIVLVEGYKDAAWDKIWVHPFAGGADEISIHNVIYEIGGPASLRHGDVGVIASQVAYWLIRQQLLKPLYGGVLIGGKSVRMGSPKTMLPAGEGVLVERIYNMVKARCNRAVLLGAAPLPESLAGVERLADPPGFEGPLAGLMAARRHAPFADWLIVAVDLPNLDHRFLGKLVRQSPAFRFIGARSPGGPPEPLCALYSSQILAALDRSFDGDFSVSRLLAKLGINGNPALWDGWRLKNANVPSDLV